MPKPLKNYFKKIKKKKKKPCIFETCSQSNNSIPNASPPLPTLDSTTKFIIRKYLDCFSHYIHDFKVLVRVGSCKGGPPEHVLEPQKNPQVQKP